MRKTKKLVFKTLVKGRKTGNLIYADERTYTVPNPFTRYNQTRLAAQMCYENSELLEELFVVQRQLQKKS